MESNEWTNINASIWRLPNGRLHRIDGPAYIYGNYLEWWINGHHLAGQLFEWSRDFNIDLNNLSNEDKQMIALYWGNYDGK